MRRFIRRCAAAMCFAGSVFATLALSRYAHAEIRILKSNGDPVPATAYTLEFNPKVGGYDIALIELYNPNLESVFDIRASGGEYIHSVIIDIDGPAAGSPVIVKIQGESPWFLGNVGFIMQTGTAETILNKVQTTQDIGSITVEAIGDIIAGRDVIGPITATTANNSLRGITSVQAVRDILGDCTADNGRILLVWAQRHIGAQADPILIRARHSVYQVMGDDVFADIFTRHNGGTGGFWALVCNRFTGTLSTEKLIFNPWNGLDSRLAIYQQFDGLISIGKNYNSASQYIELPPLPTGFSGQIIVNADGAPGGIWNAPVRVGPNGHPSQVVLSTPGYPQTSAQLGGGSVGLVPFRLHDEACVPVNGASVTLNAGGPPVAVSLRHYGPVNYSASAITIARRPAGSSTAFTFVSPASFSVSRSADLRSIIVTSAPGITAFEPGWQYRIQPTSNLYCDISTLPPALATPPSVIWDADYLFTVHASASCSGDVSGDGAVNVTDLLLIISNWGPTSPSMPSADTNGDGHVNVVDLLAVIGQWGSCP